MIPVNPWEHQNAIKTLYAKCVGDVCSRHKITRMELDLLLFLANNPRFDTATDMVEIRYLSKSQVSTAIKTLEEGGFIRKEYADNNKKTAHLKICEAASSIIADGRAAQEKFVSLLLQGLSLEEMECIKRCFQRMWENIDSYLKERTEC